MASQLMLIKSRKLLPKVAEVTDLEDDLEQDLLSQIEEYRKFKLLGEHLEAKHQDRGPVLFQSADRVDLRRCRACT